MSKSRTISKILKLKDHRKTEAEIEVKRASDKADEAKTKLQSLEDDYSDTIRYFNEKHEEGALDINNLISCYDFFSRINCKITEQKKVHTRRQDELSCRKDDLVNAHREKRVFEILKDKAVKKEHKERQEVEQKENDFFALSRRPR